ncbi:MAG TPA: adenylate/guanylate cyclase domain-containing protein [Acidimicrobiia bacterium]|nr:adenylate/guanylate cyclase domain-containing protein [Acidimicrobiia bacterium]
MRGIPDIRYARCGPVHLAYQVFGAGTVDLVMIAGGFSHLELRWEDPDLAHRWRTLAAFSRVIAFDKRGAGLSDRAAALPPYEEQVCDVLAVMDAAGSESAVLHGFLDGGFLAALVAATHPERCRGLILDSCPARVLRAPDYPFGFAPDDWDRLLEQVDDEWFLDDLIALIAPDKVDDEAYKTWFRRYARAGAGPGGLAAIMRNAAGVDIRDVLPSIQVPTLVLARRGGALVTVESAAFVAESIPDARLVVTGDADHDFRVANLQPLIEEIEEFVTGTRGTPPGNRALATILFTDIAGSTVRAAEVGDSRWREILNIHDDLAERSVARSGGRLVKSIGDGVVATFDGPARAVRCAQAFVSSARTAGIDVRAGVHTGEVELRDGDVGGIAVHITARVAGLAGAGEVLVSRTVTDLVAGSGIEFEDRCEHELKGVPGTWHLYAARS